VSLSEINVKKYFSLNYKYTVEKKGGGRGNPYDVSGGEQTQVKV
jgi:hypothetical protein